MKWERGHQSRNVEDRRGSTGRGKTAAKVGGAGVVIAGLLAILGQALGVDLSGIFGGDSSSSSGSGTSSEPSTQSGSGAIPKDQDADRELVEFVNFVIDDVQGTFAQVFAREGKPKYQPANLVLFTEEIDTGCGLSSSAIGPFYCPPDHKAYIDLSFYRVLRDRLGAGGDYAQAYVLAHEIGHHVQNLLGTDVKVRQQAQRDPERQNELSVRQELQADCYAGVWAHSTQQRKLLERGDIEESVNAAAQIGDDRLAESAGAKVNPETWTHGSSAQRVRWFEKGLEVGTLATCDTFNASSL